MFQEYFLLFSKTISQNVSRIFPPFQQKYFSHCFKNISSFLAELFFQNVSRIVPPFKQNYFSKCFKNISSFSATLFLKMFQEYFLLFSRTFSQNVSEYFLNIYLKICSFWFFSMEGRRMVYLLLIVFA